MDLRHYLSGSVLLYAVTVYLFGAGQSWGIRSIWYYYVIMALQGALSSTGWPGVVAGFGPWLGHSARGTLMGIWSTKVKGYRYPGSTTKPIRLVSLARTIRP